MDVDKQSDNEEQWLFRGTDDENFLKRADSSVSILDNILLDKENDNENDNEEQWLFRRTDILKRSDSSASTLDIEPRKKTKLSGDTKIENATLPIKREYQNTIHRPTAKDCSLPYGTYKYEECVRFRPLRSTYNRYPPARRGMYSFSSESKTWSEVPNTAITTPENITGMKPLHVEKITTMSWNVFFEDFEWKSRAKAIAAEIMSRKPDVVAFQEVTPRFVEVIQEDAFIRENYRISDPKCTGGHGLVLLSRLEGKIYRLDIHSKMDRSALALALDIDKEVFIVVNVHLESANSARYRRRQLGDIACFLSNSECAHSCIIGDFNFDSDINFDKRETFLENRNLKELLPTFVDVWIDKKTKKGSSRKTKLDAEKDKGENAVNEESTKGYTYDSKVNKMVAKFKGEGNVEQMRYDRVLLHTSGRSANLRKKSRSHCNQCAMWVAHSIEMIGKGPIGKGNIGKNEDNYIDVYPSDHFGLLANFVKTE